MADIAPDVKKRGGTCIVVEETLCLRIDHYVARNILQPDNIKESTDPSNLSSARNDTKLL